MKATPQASPKTRQAVYKRDGYRCVDCGATGNPGAKPGDLNVHHIVSRRLGGTNEPENLVTLCIACHKKRDYPALLEGAQHRQADPRRAQWKVAKRRYDLTAALHGYESAQALRAKVVCDRIRWWTEPGESFESRRAGRPRRPGGDADATP